MKLFAHIMSLVNLLAGLAWLGVILAVWPWIGVGLWPLALLGLAVLIGQRCQARALAQSQPDLEAPGLPFQPEPGWWEKPIWPRLLLAGNIVFAAAMLMFVYGRYYDRFQNALEAYNPHPMYSWLWAVLAFLALAVLLNILFDLVCVLDQRSRESGHPSTLRRFAWGLAALIVLVVLGWNFRYAQDRHPVQARLAVWPQFETVTLADGQEVELAPPPGYMRLDPEQPELKKFFREKFARSGQQQQWSLAAVYAANERAYEAIIKTLAASAREYYCPDGLAWIEQAETPVLYEIDPYISLNIARGLRPGANMGGAQSYRITSPAFYLRGQTHHFEEYDRVKESHLDAYGEVVVADRILKFRTCDGVKGAADEARVQAFLENSRQWLEALSGWAPPEGPAGLQFGSGFPSGLRRSILGDCEQPKFSRVTALAHDGRRRLLVGRETGEVEIWDVQTNKAERVVPPLQPQAVNHLSFTPDGEGFFSASFRTGLVQFRGSGNGELRQLLPTFQLSRPRHASSHNFGPIVALGDDFPARYGTGSAESHSGQYWLSGSGQKTVSGLFLVPKASGLFLFEARTGTLYPPLPKAAEPGKQKIGRLGEGPRHSMPRSSRAALQTCLSDWIAPEIKDEPGLETGRAARRAVNRAQRQPGKPIAPLKACLSRWMDLRLGGGSGAGRGSSALAVDRENGLVAVATGRGAIDLYQIRLINQVPGLELVQSTESHKIPGLIKALHFGPGGGKLYSVSSSGQIDEWSLPGLDKTAAGISGWHQVQAARFMPGSNLLALAGLVKKEGGGYNRTMGLIDLVSGRRLTRPMISEHTQLEFIPSLGKLIAVHDCAVSDIDIPDDFL